MELREPGGPEALEGITEPLVVLGVDFVVPLLQPRQVLLDDGEERGQALGGPTVLFGDFGGVCGNGPAEFKGVLAGPSDEEGRVGVAAHQREADEALLRDAEGAAQAPVARLPEVGGAGVGGCRSRPACGGATWSRCGRRRLPRSRCPAGGGSSPLRRRFRPRAAGVLRVRSQSTRWRGRRACTRAFREGR